MSWAANYEVTDGVVGDVQAFNVSTPEHAEQYERAVEAARQLISSGAVGKSIKKFKVALSGHGNENHEPAKGWASDFINISVVQVEEE